MTRLATWVRVGLLMAVFAASAALGAQPELRWDPREPDAIEFEPSETRHVRLTLGGAGTETCLDEVELFGEDPKINLALAESGAKATASSALAGYPIHKIAHLNDGKYGNSHSWIAADRDLQWVKIELPKAENIGRVVLSRDRQGRYRDRTARYVKVETSLDGRTFRTVAEVGSVAAARNAPPRGGGPGRAPPPALQTAREVIAQFRSMVGRFSARGIDVTAERVEFGKLEARLAKLDPEESPLETRRAFLDEARRAKRALMFRDPDMAVLERVLFVKRHPYVPSHNYSDFMDGRLRGGGGVCVLDIPRRDGRLVPESAKLTQLFDARAGIARDVTPDWDAKTIWFAYMRDANGRYRSSGTDRKGKGAPEVPVTHRWHLYRVPVAGGDAVQVTRGPHHDYYPCVLPDGDITFISTRCNMRFLCWVPTTMTLHRMRPDGTDIRPISHNNLSGWFPTVRRDGRIMWTRSEYQDKGADYGHTIWTMRPDGTHSELVYGNNTPHNIMNAMEVPGRRNELLATKISHFGDFNGPLCYIDLSKSPFDSAAMQQIPGCRSGTSNGGIYRDPWPISRDLLLCSHKDGAHFSIYIMDRWGNRELVFRDPAISCMTPVLLRPRKRPPVIAEVTGTGRGPATMLVIDVYDGLGSTVKRGSVKWLRICHELPSMLETYGDGHRKETYTDFRKYYASPNDKVTGPSGWPSYVAKSIVGLVPVEPDGSAHFTVPADVMFYFQALDADFNEVQRMRSVIQAKRGESRTCLGCHDDRTRTGMPNKRVKAMARPPSKPVPEPWGSGPFWYEKVVQPVLDRRCISCHTGVSKTAKKSRGPSIGEISLDSGVDAGDAGDDLLVVPDKPPVLERAKRIDLTSRTDAVSRAPASYRTLVRYVNFFNVQWQQRHTRAQPLTFGTVKSRLFTILRNENHGKLKLSPAELRAIKCWVDLNCPLWGDYQHRDLRAEGQSLCAVAASCGPECGEDPSE